MYTRKVGYIWLFKKYEISKKKSMKCGDVFLLKEMK